MGWLGYKIVFHVISDTKKLKLIQCMLLAFHRTVISSCSKVQLSFCSSIFSGGCRPKRREDLSLRYPLSILALPAQLSLTFFAFRFLFPSSLVMMYQWGFREGRDLQLEEVPLKTEVQCEAGAQPSLELGFSWLLVPLILTEQSCRSSTTPLCHL